VDMVRRVVPTNEDDRDIIAHDSLIASGCQAGAVWYICDRVREAESGVVRLMNGWRRRKEVICIKRRDKWINDLRLP
jgi:hypothetical protein